MKNWFTVKAAAEGSDVAEVHILDEIGYWGVNAKEFLAEFRAIKASKVDLIINSPGGSVFEAIAMFNGMRATGKEITVRVLGIAASAASYIAMAGDKIVMPANTYMFLHNPINAVYGNADDMREMADVLDKIGASLTATYAKRFKGDAAALDELLSAEAYLTAAECLEHGFCDEVTDEIAATAVFEVERLPVNVQALFKARAAAPAAVEAPSLAAQIGALAKAAGFEALTPVFVTDPAATSVEAVEALIGDALEIKALAEHAGLADRAEPLIRARSTVAAARSALCSALAEADAATAINTAAPAKNVQASAASDGWSPSAQWAAIREMKNGSK